MGQLSQSKLKQNKLVIATLQQEYVSELKTKVSQGEKSTELSITSITVMLFYNKAFNKVLQSARHSLL